MTQYRTMVALGSSFAAGPGIAPLADRAAGRSTRNYAHLVSRALGAQLIDATVSGATTATILDRAQWAGGRRFPPQILSVPEHADLITITAGGNDIGYLLAVMLTAGSNWLAARPLTHAVGLRMRRSMPLITPTGQRMQAATAGLERIVVESRRRAPASRVVLVDYVPIVGDDTRPGPAVFLRAGEISLIRDLAAELSGAFAEASRRTGADLVPAASIGLGHGLSSDQPWVIGLQRGRGDGTFFHPNGAGMRAAADAVLRTLTG